ncbi:redoxin domain-containing protein [Chitinophaga sp. SYP-B3965]|uniref:redoxin domain-containing protein n=1 Tax=Chitinophaga sp. SYP-B3965 TaxID=2663120 RepID=UPI001299E620|nr:redoxin domain-containing protein [Chitinophaga sp. SYP-B3965]MRG43573.1 redoxin domain-containing protein [Chitinophaga sp. SYP-B3965]
MKPLLVICGCLFFLTLNAQQPVKIKAIEGASLPLSGINKKLTAIVFLSPDCPLSQNYTLVLNDIQKSKKDLLQIVGVLPNAGYYSEHEIVSFKKKYAIDFALLRDKNEALVSYTHATITPEVFLYDSKGVLLYKGAIDDWAISLGKKKRQAEQHYLRNAIDNYLQHKEVNPSQTKAVGCFISNK